MKLIEVPRPRSHIRMPSIGYGGRFTVELIDAQTKLVKRHLEFDNLITNVGLDSLLDNSIYPHKVTGDSFSEQILFCAVGTNSTAPAATQTTLGAEIAPAVDNRTKSNGAIPPGTVTYVAGSPDYWYRRGTWLFGTAQGNGNLTEIGLFTASSGGTMFTRQLLKDGGGTPTTVVKTSAEELRVTYEFRCRPAQADVTGTVTLDGVSYDYTVRPCDVDNANNFSWGGYISSGDFWNNSSANHASCYETQTLSAREGTGPSGSASACSSCAPSAYSAGTYYRDYTAIWQSGVGNFGLGVGSVTFLAPANTGSHASTWQISFAATTGGARIPKTNTKRLTLVFRHSVARV